MYKIQNREKCILYTNGILRIPSELVDAFLVFGSQSLSALRHTLHPAEQNAFTNRMEYGGARAKK